VGQGELLMLVASCKRDEPQKPKNPWFEILPEAVPIQRSL